MVLLPAELLVEMLKELAALHGDPPVQTTRPASPIRRREATCALGESPLRDD
jgi:hypothetical protein